ncbi:MAG: hypothetical protein QM302_07060 [Acidobacteriota bacterium]|nr:hypothetical protein [Acidobacteriota bacterium]
MPDSFRISLRNYLVMVVSCLGSAAAAMALWLLNRETSWIGIAIPLFVYFDVSLLLLISLGMWAIGIEDADARETCDPILRRYKRDRNVDKLLYGYELWRIDGHGMATRIDFLRAVIDLLIADGYVYEAADLLNDYQKIATTTDSIRDYRRYRKVCERRISAVLAEAAEQERRWEAERREEERMREQRRREALETE